MQGIIDRFEGPFVVIEIEDEKMINIEITKIPLEAKEGDVIDIGETIKINYEETKKRKEKIKKLTEEIWQ